MTNIQAAAVSAIALIRAVADCIKDLEEVPSGHLYAQLVGFLTLENYNLILAKLVEAKLISVTPGHLITWIGPK